MQDCQHDPSTASAWVAAAAIAERLVAQLSTLSKADEERFAFALSDKINELQGKAMMERAEWEALLLKEKVGASLLMCYDVCSGTGSITNQLHHPWASVTAVHELLWCRNKQ